MTISHVWFDIGYTLLYMKREITYRQTLISFGEDVPLDVLEREFHIVDKLFMREYPGVFLKPRGVYMPWFLGVLNYRLGISLDVSRLDACWLEAQNEAENYWLPFENVRDVLADLKASSLRMGVISNWDDSARGLLQSHGMIDYFDHCIISSEIGINKPDPEIFRVAMQQAQVEPHECLYVGDNYYDDAVGCRKAGMEAVIINRFDHLGVEEIDDAPIIHNLAQLKDYLDRSNRIDRTG